MMVNHLKTKLCPKVIIHLSSHWIDCLVDTASISVHVISLISMFYVRLELEKRVMKLIQDSQAQLYSFF